MHRECSSLWRRRSLIKHRVEVTVIRRTYGRQTKGEVEEEVVAGITHNESVGVREAIAQEE